MPFLDVLIVNWNAGSQLHECLQSLNAAESQSFNFDRVVIVDNGSADGSADNLPASRLPLALVRNPRNLGFAVACNQGASNARADYLLFLNPDTRVFPDTLERVLAAMERPEQAGTAICGVQLIDQDGRVTRTCARQPTVRLFLTHALGLDRIRPGLFPSHFMAEWDHGETRDVDHVIGAFYLVRRSVFEQLGGFDERFFVYLEDVDLSTRARAAGWRILYLAEARAYHRGGGTSEQVKAERLFYAIRSRILYAAKHFSRESALLVALASLAVEPIVRFADALTTGTAAQATETARAYRLLWAQAPALLRNVLGGRESRGFPEEKA